MGFKAAAIGVVLALSSVGSCALTLGALQGNSWVGRRLDVAVPAQMEAGQLSSVLCAVAEVFHADTKVPAGRVQVLAEPTERSDTVNLRIVSSAAVDELVVTVVLHVGCESAVTRRYVLLPDVPGEVTLPMPSATTDSNSNGAAAPVATAVNERAQASSSDVSSSASALGGDAVGNHRPAFRARHATNGRAPAQARGQTKTKPNRSAQTRNVAKVTALAMPQSTASAPVGGRAKLTLDPLEVLVERVKSLESASSLTQLEELVHTSQRMERMQTDMTELLSQAATNQANLRDLQERLRKAEEVKSIDWLVFVLAGLLTLCVLGIVLFWRRSADVIRILEDERRTLFAEAVHPHHAREAETHPVTPAQTPASTSTPSSVQPSNTQVDLDIDWLEVDEKGLNEIMDPKATRPAAYSELEDAEQAGGDEVTAETDLNANSQLALIDKARLFVQLGKTDQAVDILEERIRQKSADCPLVFLEILHIANEHSLKTDFRQFRDEMQQVFNVAIPEFALFRAEGRGLGAYPGLLRHITKLGPGPKVLEVIESCILLSAWGNNTEPFDLAAFKELVQMHGDTLSAMRASDAASSSASPALDAETSRVDLAL